jgi:hypothetical protein
MHAKQGSLNLPPVTKWDFSKKKKKKVDEKKNLKNEKYHCVET